MNFTDLEIFKAVVDEGGIIKASRKLHRVPSSVTSRIQQLESSMGVSLRSSCISGMIGVNENRPIPIALASARVPIQTAAVAVRFFVVPCMASVIRSRDILEY